MKVFLAGDNGKKKIIPAIHGEENVDILVSESIRRYKPYILESFYYADEATERLIPYFGDFMLDSGAFTFMGGFGFKDNSNGVDFKDYAKRYADFINRNGVDKFFELDVDVCIGYENVKKLRKYLEKATGKKPIPVWHSTRGKDDFLRCCDEYPYVALGGIVGGEWNVKAQKYIPWFISEAHRRGAKIHGLGFTKLQLLQLYHFDSVDSTAWTAGNRFGYVYKFDGRTMQKIYKPSGARLGDSKKVALHNYIEWIKFQRYADIYL